MKREIHFIPSAEVCSKEIHIELEEDRITGVRFVGGCHGNTQGIAALLCGMEREEAIRRLQGICCKQKTTSCPDQLAKALQE
ncbi:TIGR03905 family TSCPD domain-containing protein [uncultured Sanguibacteroides sp.]|uniref:TIGR03905 family TSCPD domain-containing protein n=1 Tax=uncultured Sanguibacteroides sp. TaxID=1635151 RepID=UPI0025E80FBD|nr:TIGR03905 family TSCPD domain-containing protein [uncultured Sanguibacteroides sp.]